MYNMYVDVLKNFRSDLGGFVLHYHQRMEWNINFSGADISAKLIEAITSQAKAWEA